MVRQRHRCRGRVARATYHLAMCPFRSPMTRISALALWCAAARFASAQPAATPLRLVVPVGHTRQIRSFAFSRSGDRLLSADNTARVWDARTGRELVAVANGPAPVARAMFERGDSVLVVVD